MAEHAKIRTSSKHQISTNAEQFYSDFWVESKNTNQTSLEHRKNILKRFFPEGLQGKHILEVGVGGEGGLIYLLKETNKVHGFDISDAAIRNCTRFGLDVTKINMDRDRLCFADNSLDIIFALEVFEHFANPQHALEELRRVLKPGGTLLISTPSPITYHWPRLFYPSLFEAQAFGNFLMVNGFLVVRHDNHLKTNLKPVPENDRIWGWYWETRKPSEYDSDAYLALGDYFWDQKNEFGIRRYPIEAIDLYRQGFEANKANIKARHKLTHALIYRAINGDNEFNERFNDLNLHSPALTDEEVQTSYKTLVLILLEAEKLGYPMVKEEDMAVVRESAKSFGILNII